MKTQIINGHTFDNLHQYKAYLKQESLNQCVADEKSRINLTVALLIPSFIFLAIILFGFGKRLYACIKTKCYELPEREKSVVATHQILHLQNLMKNRYPKPNSSILKRKKTILKPWYKFPSEIWQCNLVVLITLYTIIAQLQQSISEAIWDGYDYRETLPTIYITDNAYVSTLKSMFHTDARGVWYSTLIFTILLYAAIVIHFLYCIQKDSLSIYK